MKFLHTPKDDPWCCPGDNREAKLRWHVLYAISRSVPIPALATHLSIKPSEIQHSINAMRKNGDLGFKNGKLSIIEVTKLEHINDEWLGAVYDGLAPHILGHVERLDDVMLHCQTHSVVGGEPLETARWCIDILATRNPKRPMPDHWRRYAARRRAASWAVTEQKPKPEDAIKYLAEMYSKMQERHHLESLLPFVAPLSV